MIRYRWKNEFSYFRKLQSHYFYFQIFCSRLTIYTYSKVAESQKVQNGKFQPPSSPTITAKVRENYRKNRSIKWKGVKSVNRLSRKLFKVNWYFLLKFHTLRGLLNPKIVCSIFWNFEEKVLNFNIFSSFRRSIPNLMI